MDFYYEEFLFRAFKVLESVEAPEIVIVGEKSRTPTVNRFAGAKFIVPSPTIMETPLSKTVDGPIVWRFWKTFGWRYMHDTFKKLYDDRHGLIVFDHNAWKRMGEEIITAFYSLDMPNWYFEHPHKCPLCQDEMFCPEQFDCGHLFHKHCLLNSTLCPVCHPPEPCPICGEMMLDFLTVECGHKFHAHCVYKGFDLCPVCLPYETCPICLEDTQRYVTTDCKHKFHDHCLTKWISENDECPLCRQIIIK